MQKQEQEEGERDPEPGHLDKVDVQQVAFLGEVGGRLGGGVRLRGCVVGRGAGAGVEEGEEGAEEQRYGVDGEEEGFEGGGEESCERVAGAALGWGGHWFGADGGCLWVGERAVGCASVAAGCWCHCLIRWDRWRGGALMRRE